MYVCVYVLRTYLLLLQVSKGTVVKITETIIGYVKRHTVAPVLTKAQQHEALEEEIRQRMIKAQKISYWRQFQQGLLGRDAARILIALADNVLSDHGRYTIPRNVDICALIRLYRG